MVLYALTNEEVSYESDLDSNKGTDNAIKFYVKSLPARLVAHINDKSLKYHNDQKTKEVTTEIHGNQAAIDFVMYGLVRVENFTYPNGKPVELKHTTKKLLGKEWDVLTEDSINLFPSSLIVELSKMITEGNIVKEDDKKN